MRLNIFFFLFFHSAFVSAHPYAIFKLDQNNSDKTFYATITLKNTENAPLEHWQLAFDFIRPIININEGTINKHIGYFYLISPKQTQQAIPPKGSYVFHLHGKWLIKHVTDAPSGYFLVKTNPLSHAQSIVSLDAKTITPLVKPAADQDTYTLNLKKNQTSIEDNPILPNITLNQSLIIPLPAALDRSAGTFILNNHTAALVTQNSKDALTSVRFFTKSIAVATGYHLKAALFKKNRDLKNSILFTHEDADFTLGNEGYILQVSANNIFIRANSDAGFFYAIQSLRQLLPPAIFDKKLAAHVIWSIPCLTIRDYPRFSYRGLSLDVARHFIPVVQIKRLIDLMALHKLNIFQWHLTDDEGWRIEIKKYPTLTSIGAWRGFNRPIPPELGSGAKRYGGYYSQDEIRDIVQYAKERHITIIPEIDIPGHARAMLMSLPNLLKDPDDLSVYTSAQGYHDNVLSPCRENTFTVINNIMNEIATLFPGDIIHIGSDEVPQGAWTGSPKCQKLMKSLGLKNTDELQNYFLKRVEKIVQAKNKKMAVWNDAIKNGKLDLSTRVYSWTSESAGLKAAQQGYSVILMPASYLYFDLAYSAEPIEPGFYWAGLVDTFKIYSYKPLDTSWPKTITDKILGVQGAIWSENISSNQQLDYFTFPKLLALSEVAWTPKNRRNWINFSERVGRLHLPRLDHYGVEYRISPPGINLSMMQNKILEANVEFPGLELRYTTNGTLPTSSSLFYSKPVKIMNSAVNMRSFNSKNRGSRRVY